MKNKIALIFGVTGQDGSYLSRLLLKKNYIVHGVKRRSSSLNTERIDDIYQEPWVDNKSFILHYGDVTDSNSVSKVIQEIMPDEIYNLAAQSHVGVSFLIPEYTANATGLGTLRVLETIKNLKDKKKIKYYQAGSSELFGNTKQKKKNEKTLFYPRSPYAVAKLYSHFITINYRESYNIFACNGILFNHESPKRGETFVTKKIVRALCRIKKNKQNILYIGNINSKRDWGHANDYVEAMWKMLQKNKPDDYVIATGKQYSVKQFIDLTSKKLGIKLVWKKKNNLYFAMDKKTKKIIIKQDKKYFRAAEVDDLLGDSSKARKILKWKPKYNLNSLVDEMILVEMKNLS